VQSKNKTNSAYGFARASVDHKLSSEKGFTLIELLVVIAIIGLLSSIALIAFASAQQKSRDAKRISDVAQMSNAFELYFSTFKGYPSSTNGMPSPGTLVPNIASSLPSAPQPADGSCGQILYPSPVPGGTYASQYYYYPSGTPFLASDNVTMVYPDYAYYFCLGNQTGNFAPGMHILSPDEGVQ
jgi:prepilin-type N-terminal cleavage/methylation domain-containing protein